MCKKRQKICILGSTGSIGTQTLEVVRTKEDMEITALAAGSSLETLKKQILEFRPKFACLWNEKKALELKEWLKTQKQQDGSLKTEAVSGMEGLVTCAVEHSVTIVVAAIVGMIGIRPVMEAIKAGKDIALANKETLVTAGHLIMPLVQEKGVSLLPVDSEHSAIFQCLQAKTEAGFDAGWIEKIFLTASGGPFRSRKKEDFASITLEETLKHPNWTMGKKITVDSATMVNKGLEIMEAKWLFGVEYDQIQVLIQPQSIIHSMVQYRDGAVLAQLGTPDMKLPIQYALGYPVRRPMAGERLDFGEITSITFEQPDFERFPALSLAYEVGKEGGIAPTIYNAANEWAVARFLSGKCHYTDIFHFISIALNKVPRESRLPSLEEILEAEQMTYRCLQDAE